MIRGYAAADEDSVVAVWLAASRIATPFLAAEFLRTEAVNIRTRWLPKAESWVFEEDEIVVGFLSLIESEIGALFVRPDRQGRGIGRALMDHAVRLRGDLFLDVFEDNLIGRRFYERYGFRPTGKHVHEESGHSQIRMEWKA